MVLVFLPSLSIHGGGIRDDYAKCVEQAGPVRKWSTTEECTGRSTVIGPTYRPTSTKHKYIEVKLEEGRWHTRAFTNPTNTAFKPQPHNHHGRNSSTVGSPMTSDALLPSIPLPPCSTGRRRPPCSRSCYRLQSHRHPPTALHSHSLLRVL